MIKNITKIFQIASVIIFGSIFLYNCEPEADNLGEQFFDGADAYTDSIDVTAYNITNKDTLRADLTTIRTGVLGAFKEPVFGMQKATYVSQVRMASYDPDFGDNPVVDSVVLVMRPNYHSDSLTTTTDENYIYPEGAVPAKKEITSYPIVKYGKHKIENNKVIFNIKVHEVTDFLDGPLKLYYSNHNVGYNATAIGAKTFDGSVRAATITKDSDNSTLFTADASLRIPLDATFFQNKIIAKEGTNDLKDVANFIRHFRGVRISVDETDGYLFNFNADSAEIIMYYKKDKVENNVTTRVQANFKFPLQGRDSNGTYYNTRVGQYTYDRTGTPVEAIPVTPNTAGDTKLYLQGMGGPSVAIKIPDAAIAQLKSRFQNEKIGIIGAKIRVYTDTAIWSNNYGKPSTFSLVQEGATDFMSDLSVLANSPNFSFVQSYNLTGNPAYYDITITKTLKDIVEAEAANKPIIMSIGQFLIGSTGVALGYKYTSRAYALERVALVGTDPSNPLRIKLKVAYGKK